MRRKRLWSDTRDMKPAELCKKKKKKMVTWENKVLKINDQSKSRIPERSDMKVLLF